MIGIILMSHGEMANGILNSCELFFGKNIPQIKAICLKPEETPDQYSQRIQLALEEVDDGNGVVGFVDLLNGTPCNTSAMLMSDSFKIITGMNLCNVIELLGTRLSNISLSELNIEQLVTAGKDSIKDLYSYLLEE